MGIFYLTQAAKADLREIGRYIPNANGTRRSGTSICSDLQSKIGKPAIIAFSDRNYLQLKGVQTGIICNSTCNRRC